MTRRFSRTLAATAAVACAAAVLVIAPSAASAQAPPPGDVVTFAADNTSIELQGRGWGHGIGMGQWGALGYSTQHGWTYTQILDHYYGGTTMGAHPDGLMTVRLLAHDNQPTSLYLADGQMIVTKMDDGIITDSAGNMVVAAERALRFRRIAPNTFEIADAPGCSGPWTVRQGITVSGLSTIRVNPSVPDGTLAQTIGVCTGGSDLRYYRGEIRAVADPDGIQRTVNAVALENYLRGVVPRESPASWGSSGGGAGMHALRVQAVAARTYAISQNRYSYAKSCDTAQCQVYGGRALHAGGSTTVLEDHRSDQAVLDTAGQIRLRSNGQPANTMYSASTGGHTAYHSSVGFPAVVDLGDSVSPRHTWTRSISRALIEARYNRGTLERIEILSRNGLGADGGRVDQMRLVFSGGTVDTTGPTFRSNFYNDVWSDWFTASAGSGVGQPVAPPVVCPAEGLGGLHRLYSAYFLREPDADGFAYWAAELDRGRTLASISGHFAGSKEFVANYGVLDHTQFIDRIYTEVLKRDADPAGRAYWIDLLETGKQGRGAVMLNFSNSAEYKNMTGNCA